MQGVYLNHTNKIILIKYFLKISGFSKYSYSKNKLEFSKCNFEITWSANNANKLYSKLIEISGDYILFYN